MDQAAYNPAPGGAPLAPLEVEEPTSSMKRNMFAVSRSSYLQQQQEEEPSHSSMTSQQQHSDIFSSTDYVLRNDLENNTNTGVVGGPRRSPSPTDATMGSTHDDEPDDVTSFFSPFRTNQNGKTARKSTCQRWMQEILSLTKELIHFNRRRHWRKKLLAVICVTFFCLVFYDLLFGDFIQTQLQIFMEWMTENTGLAVLAFVGLFIVATLIFVPATLLILGAGYSFSVVLGPVQGSIAALLASLLGSLLGALLSFYRSRYMMRDVIEVFSKRYPIVQAADVALQENGFKILVLLRLCPLVPFNGLNYIGGITSVSWEDFTFSLIGIIPLQLVLVTIGAAGETIQEAYESDQPLSDSHQLAILIITSAGVAFGIIALVVIYKVCKKQLQKQLHLNSQQFEEVIHPHHVYDVHEPSVEVAYVNNEEEDEPWYWIWA